MESGEYGRVWGGGQEGGKRRNFPEVESVGFGIVLGVNRIAVSNPLNSTILSFGCWVGVEPY